MKRLAFQVLMLAIPVAVVGAAAILLGPVLRERFEPQIVAYLASTLSSEERDAIYEKLGRDFKGRWEVVPEADVARILVRNAIVSDNQAEVVTNNAGMRASRPYRAKPPDVFRIACLGDSLVLGSGGLEEDRFCDQIEAFYRDAGVTVDGRRVETVALGISSWTLVQEASYLASRISSYDPDLILLVTVHNDIADAFGVTGRGASTRGFSPQRRRMGSAYFGNKMGFEFGNPRCCSALQWDLSPESRLRWNEAMSHLARLVELQERRGKHILLSVLDTPQSGGRHGHFTELYNHHLARSGIDEHLLVVSYPIREEGMVLPHDPTHPTRRGHSVLRDQYLHALDRLGWIPVGGERLPDLHPEARIDLDPAPDPASLDAHQKAWVQSHVPASLDFRGGVDPEVTHAILGGLFPARSMDRNPHAPWASIRSGFVLRLPPGRSPERVVVEVAAPPLPELFPLHIDLRIDGLPAGQFAFERPQPSGHYLLTASLPEGTRPSRVVEVVLETPSYYVIFNEGRMRSLQILGASLE